LRDEDKIDVRKDFVSTLANVTSSEGKRPLHQLHCIQSFSWVIEALATSPYA